MRRAALLLFAFVLWGGQALAATVAPQSPGLRPSPDTDEAGLWLLSDKEEERLKASAMIERDPALTAYLREVICKVSAAYCRDIRVYVVNQPYFNASMAPNGVMIVFTGLLLRAQNEAQLAFVLGHEIGHYVGRHSLQQWRKVKDTAGALLIFSIGTSAAGVGILGSVAELAAASTIYGYSRDKEREADAFGFESMSGAGYAGRECAATWRYLVEEQKRSDFEKTRREEARGSIFRTHPLTSERIATLDRLAQAKSGGDAGTERFRAVTASHLGAWLKQDLRRRDFGQSLFLMERLIANGHAPGVVHFYQAEAYRLRHKAGDEALALENYEQAARHADVPPAAFRELGHAYWRKGDKQRADASLRQYLALAPGAEDRLIVEEDLKRLWSGAMP
jgi:tetratricopeptide (TPR) repeat protein